MRNVLVAFCIVSTALAMFSCRSSKEAVSLTSLNGEWNIAEINGTAVTPSQDQSAPFIGFDTTTGKVYGNSGCNRMTGSFDVNAKAGSISLGQLAGTRMMCADMTLEQNVLNALAQVKSYKKLGKASMALCNAANRPVIVLDKKAAGVKLSALNGEWLITEADGEAIPTGMEKQPFIAFDLKAKTIHGNAGCNLMNGGFKTDVNNAKSISFPALACTMMAGPGMDVETKVLKALNEARSFDLLSGGGIGLYNGDGALVMVLTKK